MYLPDYDIIIINTSSGKDSLCSLWQINTLAERQGFPKKNIHLSHQDLGEAEWPGAKELAEEQAKLFGFKFHITKRRDKNGYEESFLEYAERRNKWPDNKNRWCTSDFKRGPGARVVTAITKDMDECRVLYVFGFRSEESPFRKKKTKLEVNKRLTTKKRHVDEYLPIHQWSTEYVWNVIKGQDLPYHYAYELGMPRLSCVFCIFSPFDALVVAGKANPRLLDIYLAAEERMGFTFKNGESLKDVVKAIEDGYEPTKIKNWVM